MAVSAAEPQPMGRAARDKQVVMRVLPERHAPLAARRAVAGLRAVPPDRLDDVQLLVTELVTNSVRHAALRADQPIQVAVGRSRETLHVEVMDAGPGFEPPSTPSDPLAAGGRGLVLLELLSDRCGVRCESRTHVWFEMDVA